MAQENAATPSIDAVDTSASPAASHEVTLKEKIAFGCGNMNNLLMNNILGSLLNPIYNVALGVNPALLGTATAIPRLWDAISDPIVGSISDNFRSRWGRRKPFMLLGACISALSLAAIWQANISWTENTKFIYLVVLSLVFYTGNTLFMVPYQGLGLALSDDYNARTSLFAFKSLVDTLGGFLVPWFYWLVTRPCFGGTLQGTRVLSAGMALWLIVFALIPMMFCRERYDNRIANQEKMPILRGIKETMTNKPFLLMTFAMTLMFFGFFASSGFGYFLNLFYIFSGDESAASVYVGLGGTAWKLASLLTLPIVLLTAKKFGKRPVFIAATAIGLLGSFTNFFCWNPAYPWLQMLPGICLGAGISCMLLMSDSMMADVCDLDELKCGIRREAMYGAIYGWFSKVGLTLAGLVSGILVVYSGYHVDKGAEQGMETFQMMMFLSATVAAAGMLVALLLMCFYNLDAAKMAEVKAMLEKQRGNSAK